MTQVTEKRQLTVAADPTKTAPAPPWPLGTILAGDQCHALPPTQYIQQRCLVRKDHVENGHPHQNYGGLVWFDKEARDGA